MKEDNTQEGWNDTTDDPLEFLKSIQRGFDPRKNNKLIDAVLNASNGDFDPPHQEDWLEILEIAASMDNYSNVSLEESIKAAKTIAEYKHSKLKHLSISNVVNETSTEPLTEIEIELFKEVWNRHF